MDLGLGGRIAVVTGASKGIGLAIATALSREGVSVAAGALHGSPELDELAQAGDVLAVQVDLAEPDGPATLIRKAVERFGGIDILVNNVGGVQPRTEGFLSVTDADWERTLTLNLLAAARTMRAAIPVLLGREGANIVTVASVNAALPDPAVIDYSAAKAALRSLCKSLSKEFGGRIRVNTVSPGPVRTDLWLADGGVAATVGRASGADPEDVARAAAGQSPTGRFSTPEEVAAIVAFLASERAANVTGSDYVIDGGLLPTI